MNYKTINQSIKGKSYKLYVSDNPAKQKIGLSKHFRYPVKKNQGMIFIYKNEEPSRIFTMVNTKHKLKIIFINEKNEIVHEEIGLPGQYKKIMCEKPSKYVIEIII